jgi:hypothetical protein
MKRISLLAASFIILAGAGGCNLVFFSDGTVANDISYFSKEVELWTYIDADGFDLQPVENHIYGEDGMLEVVFKFYYEDQEDSGYYTNTRTDVFEVDEAGALTLVEYYIYEYVKDDWEYVDDDGYTVQTFDYIISRAETHTPDDTLVLFYDVTYLTSPTEWDYYLTIIDQRVDPAKVIARQESTYLDVDLGAGVVTAYRTEQFFDLADPEDAEVSLSREFASWYSSTDPFEYLYELYHTVRGEQGSTEDRYYLTQYSRDDNGNIYEQADEDYDPIGPPPGTFAIPVDSSGTYLDGSYDLSGAVFPADQFVYPISFVNIGAKATVLYTKYDSLGNIILDERYLNGRLTEYTSYSYDTASNLIDQSHFTQGGALLYDRTSIKYIEETRDDVYYWIIETSTFKYYDYQNERSVSPVFDQEYHERRPESIRDFANNHHRY